MRTGATMSGAVPSARRLRPATVARSVPQPARARAHGPAFLRATNTTASATSRSSASRPSCSRGGSGQSARRSSSGVGARNGLRHAEDRGARCGIPPEEGRVLLVREAHDGLWTLPGGWADVNDSPSRAVRAEIEQEAGFRTRVRKLAALYDRNAHGHTPSIFHSWKAFFLCDDRRAATPAAATRRTPSGSSIRRAAADVARPLHAAQVRACSSTGSSPTSDRLRLNAARRQRSMRNSKSALCSRPDSAFTDQRLFNV